MASNLFKILANQGSLPFFGEIREVTPFSRGISKEAKTRASKGHQPVSLINYRQQEYFVVSSNNEIIKFRFDMYDE